MMRTPCCRRVLVPMELSIEQGRFVVQTARRAVEEYVLHRNKLAAPPQTPDGLRGKGGVFVTLSTYPEGLLRGCIGHPYPDSLLIEALIDSAISACSHDPRFPPVSKDELEAITVEVTVLTPPEIIRVKKPSEYPKQVQVGRHGLMVKKGWYQGLLLPQVAAEEGWDAEEFLSQTCRKAGLPLTAWMDEDTKVMRFEGLIHAEDKPRGSIRRKG